VHGPEAIEAGTQNLVAFWSGFAHGVGRYLIEEGHDLIAGKADLLSEGGSSRLLHDSLAASPSVCGRSQRGPVGLPRRLLVSLPLDTFAKVDCGWFLSWDCPLGWSELWPSMPDVIPDGTIV
jgi:hypothetical protein